MVLAVATLALAKMALSSTEALAQMRTTLLDQMANAHPTAKKASEEKAKTTRAQSLSALQWVQRFQAQHRLPPS